MTFTLADAFNERKRTDAQINTWKNRLTQANRVTKYYKTKEIEGKKAFEPLPGSVKEYDRHYTVQECLKQLEVLIKKDNIKSLISLLS